MAQYIHAHKVPHKNINIIFGCRRLEDGLYLNELKQLEKDEPGFHFYPTYSRETDVPEGSYTGYVHGVYEQLTKANGGELTPANFYLCGWKNMVDEARERLVQLGYDKKDIHLELYG